LLTKIEFMKNKIIVAIILCVAGFAFAESAPSAPSIGKSAPREHRGFYSSMSFGYAYNWYKNSRNDVDWRAGYTDIYKTMKEEETDYFEFGGGSFTLAEFKFGVALGNLIAIHSVFNFGFYAGSIDYRYEMHNYACSVDNVCEDNPVGVHEPKAVSEIAAYGFRTYFGFMFNRWYHCPMGYSKRADFGSDGTAQW
jgi:hypothetical protein